MKMIPISILGEKFYIEMEENDYVYIHHKVWNFMGYGETFNDAIFNLIEEVSSFQNKYIYSQDPDFLDKDNNRDKVAFCFEMIRTLHNDCSLDNLENFLS